MNYLSTALIFVMFVAFSVAVSMADIKGGLVAYWPLDGNAEDVVGGNDGEVEGDPKWLSGADAWVGEGTLLCDGLDDRILAGDFNPSEGTDELTISLWVFLNEQKETQFLKKGDDWSDNNMMWQFEIHGDGELSIGRSGSQADFGIIIPFKEWVHLAVTVAEDEAILYLNGESVSNGEFIMGTGTKSTLRIGATQIPHRFIDGMLDEVMLHNRALEPDEIKELAEGLDSATILPVEPAVMLATTWAIIKAQR
jgi:hypothetical protein